MSSWHTDFVLGGWLVSPKLNRISKDGLTVGIKHKSMAVLVLLADADGEVLDRDEIMDSIWPGMEVTDDVLTQSIVELRKAFDDDARHPAIIETISRVGFRLIVPVTLASRTARPTTVLATNRHRMMAIVLVVVGVLLWSQLGRQDVGRNPVITVYEPPSIAVLPFVNMSDNPENEYFSEGLSEEILILLGRIPGLKVIGRTSSFAFKGKNEDLRVIGQTLGVNTLLEGSVRTSGDQLRVSAQLIDVVDGTKIWSKTYDRTMTEVFEVQDDVSAAIISALQIHVGGMPNRGRPTESSEAYLLFLKARGLLDAQQGEEAIKLLRQAMELDPNFAEAIELLAFGYWQQGGTSIPLARAQELCNETAAIALAIEPDLTFARALYQLTSLESRSDRVALEMLEQAWREQPSNSARLRTLIYEMTYRGYLREAHQFAVQFVELDPRSPVAHYSLGESFVALGHTSEASLSLRISLELDNYFAKWFVPEFDLVEGRDESAIAHYEAELKSDGIGDLSWVRELVTAARDPNKGKEYLDSRVPQIVASLPEEYASDWQVTLNRWYLAFGFLDHYYEEIFAAGPNAEVWTLADVYVWLGTIFRRVGFTEDPRYLEVAELLGMFDIWEQRGPPDFCEKLEGRWICE